MNWIEKNLKNRRLDKEYFVKYGEFFLFEMWDKLFSVEYTKIKVKKRSFPFAKTVAIIEIFHGFLHRFEVKDPKLDFLYEIQTGYVASTVKWRV